MLVLCFLRTWVGMFIGGSGLSKYCEFTVYQFFVNFCQFLFPTSNLIPNIIKMKLRRECPANKYVVDFLVVILVKLVMLVILYHLIFNACNACNACLIVLSTDKTLLLLSFTSTIVSLYIKICFFIFCYFVCSPSTHSLCFLLFFSHLSSLSSH